MTYFQNVSSPWASLRQVSIINNFRDLLDEARDYHLMPERRPLLQSFRSRPRCCNYIMGHVFAVGGLTKSGNVAYSLLSFGMFKTEFVCNDIIVSEFLPL